MALVVLTASPAGAAEVECGGAAVAGTSVVDVVRGLPSVDVTGSVLVAKLVVGIDWVVGVIVGATVVVVPRAARLVVGIAWVVGLAIVDVLVAFLEVAIVVVDVDDILLPVVTGTPVVDVVWGFPSVDVTGSVLVNAAVVVVVVVVGHACASMQFSGEEVCGRNL